MLDLARACALLWFQWTVSRRICPLIHSFVSVIFCFYITTNPDPDALLCSVSLIHCSPFTPAPAEASFLCDREPWDPFWSVWLLWRRCSRSRPSSGLQHWDLLLKKKGVIRCPGSSHFFGGWEAADSDLFNLDYANERKKEKRIHVKQLGFPECWIVKTFFLGSNAVFCPWYLRWFSLLSEAQ